MQQSLLYGVIGLLTGLLVAGAVAVAVDDDSEPANETITASPGSHASMSMDDMAATLEDKRGDEFDRAFLAMMIAHHQGALEMADLAKQYARHDELKKLADEITTAQDREITQMRAWQQQWGYGSVGGDEHGH